MSSLMYGCFGDIIKYQEQLNKLKIYLSIDGKYIIQEIKGDNFIIGSVQKDDKIRCSYLPKYKLSVVQSGHIYEPKHTINKTELDIIANLYDIYGINLTSKIEGPFAIIIFDHKSNSLFAINDELGSQPCYYTIVGNTVFLSSEGEAFTKAGIVPPELNYDALAELFTVGFTVGNGTLLNNIYRLTHSSNLSCSNACFRITNNQYSTNNTFGGPAKKWYKDIDLIMDDYIQKIVKYYDNEKIILGLSGGLDSRLILGYLLKQGVNFEAVTFKDPLQKEQNDIIYATIIANKFGFKHKIEEEDFGYTTSIDFLLNSRFLNWTPRIIGSAGELLRGKTLKRAKLLDNINAIKEIKRLFTKSFQKKLTTDPMEKIKIELNKLDCENKFRRLELLHFLHIFSFFRKDSPSLHRYESMFIRNIHFPYFNKRLIDYISEIPPEKSLKNRLCLKIFIKFFPELLSTPSTTANLMNKNLAKIHIQRTSLDEKQYLKYFYEFQKFSPLWQEEIFTNNFKDRDEKIFTSFYNIWHDYYFGHTESVKKMKKIENSLIQSEEK